MLQDGDKKKPCNLVFGLAKRHGIKKVYKTWNQTQISNATKFHDFINYLWIFDLHFIIKPFSTQQTIQIIKLSIFYRIQVRTRKLRGKNTQSLNFSEITALTFGVCKSFSFILHLRVSKVNFLGLDPKRFFSLMCSLKKQFIFENISRFFSGRKFLRKIARNNPSLKINALRNNNNNQL